MEKEACTEGKLLALHTANVCLARALVLSGTLDKTIFNQQLDQGVDWLRSLQQDHAAQAFEALLPMLKDV